MLSPLVPDLSRAQDRQTRSSSKAQMLVILRDPCLGNVSPCPLRVFVTTCSNLAENARRGSGDRGIPLGLLALAGASPGHGHCEIEA